MNNSDYINGILKHIRGLSSINYQNAVGCILSTYYEGVKTYEMPSPYGGDDKNDGWVVEDALFYQIFSPIQFSSSFASEIANKFEEDLDSLMRLVYQQNKWNGIVKQFVFLVNTRDTSLPKDPNRQYDKIRDRLIEKYSVNKTFLQKDIILSGIFRWGIRIAKTKPICEDCTRINMKEKFKQLRSFNWRLFAALCALALIPAIYQTVKTFIISSNNQSAVFDIIGQMEWFDLINETLQAFLIIPLYSILNKIFKNDEENFAGYVFKTGLLTFLIYTLFSICVLVYGAVLVKKMNPGEIDIATTSIYLQLETVAFMIGIIVSFINVVFVIVGKDKNVYIFLVINTVLSVISDFSLIPRLGVYGVAVSNIVVNTLLAIASFLLLYFQKHIKFCRFRKDDLSVLKEWCKVGVFSGTQQFIDNFVYAVMICKMVNMVAEQGNYWIANNFIWGWLLIPITALSEVIRRDCKDGYAKLKQFNYYFIVASVIVLWSATIPLWTPFFRYAERLQNANDIFLIVIKLVPFYIAYAGCAIIDNIFIGLGKTLYNTINSLVINLVYYGIFYILYITETIAFSMDVIIMMFGFGMVVHFAISLIEEKLFLRRFEIKNQMLNDKDENLEAVQ